MIAAGSGNHSLIGSSVKRKEDPLLLSGKGVYADDVKFPGQLYVAIVRSPYASALIKKVDFSKVAGRPGVVLTLDGAALKDKVHSLPITFSFLGTKLTECRCLAVDRVKYVGEPVAAVVASDRGTAEDARDEVEVDYEPLEPSIDLLQASENENSVVYNDTILTGDVAESFKRAAYVVERTLQSHRLNAAAIEPRCVLASYDGKEDLLTVWPTTQIPFTLRNVLSSCLGLDISKVRVIVKYVGGSFGNYKYHPEDLLVSYCSLFLRRPVKWTADRREIFLGNYHAREQVHKIALAADSQGRILALKDSVIADHGAYLPREGVGPSLITQLMLPGPYKIKNVSIALRCVLSNKTPTGAYRGFGHPEACFAMERMVDSLADRMGL
ncbi:MAG: molybdopterin-dependent oxidoreductase, partial [Thaumarchaeota archaeon]|nr:molybdopterin-dependent oxidoreductase [Nitrososphaerota archaeon]